MSTLSQSPFNLAVDDRIDVTVTAVNSIGPGLDSGSTTSYLLVTALPSAP